MMDTLFTFEDQDALGVVRAVDTASVIVGVDNLELLRKGESPKIRVSKPSIP